MLYHFQNAPPTTPSHIVSTANASDPAAKTLQKPKPTGLEVRKAFLDRKLAAENLHKKQNIVIKKKPLIFGRLSKFQLINEVFKRSPFLTIEVRNELSRKLKLPVSKVSNSGREKWRIEGVRERAVARAITEGWMKYHRGQILGDRFSVPSPLDFRSSKIQPAFHSKRFVCRFLRCSANAVIWRRRGRCRQAVPSPTAQLRLPIALKRAVVLHKASLPRACLEWQPRRSSPRSERTRRRGLPAVSSRTSARSSRLCSWLSSKRRSSIAI